MNTKLRDTGDAELLRQLSLDNSDAFMMLYMRYFRNVYSAARRYLKAEDALDICQDIFLAVWDRRSLLLLIGNFRAYLSRMTQNLIYDKFRQSLAGTRSEQRFVNGQETVSSTEAVIHMKEYEQLVREAINLLPPKQREAFLLSREHGMTHERIAQHLNTSQDAVEKNISRALSFIRHKIGYYLISN